MVGDPVLAVAGGVHSREGFSSSGTGFGGWLGRCQRIVRKLPLHVMEFVVFVRLYEIGIVDGLGYVVSAVAGVDRSVRLSVTPGDRIDGGLVVAVHEFSTESVSIGGRVMFGLSSRTDVDI